MIYVTGDIHGDFSRFKDAKKAGVKKGDTLIVCGDFGFLWNGGKKEEATLKKIGKLPFTVLFVDGCHENHELLSEYEEVGFGGDKARKLSGSLYMLRRGGLYTIEEKTVFAFGGGVSTDEFSSKQDASVLLPMPEELQAASDLLAAHENHVDYIITHDAPLRLQRFIDVEDVDRINHLHTFLEDLTETVKFRFWYCGKYHRDLIIPPRYRMLFQDVVAVK